MKKYLAIDIGASSGRHIIGTVDDGKIALKEMHRFPNLLDHVDGHLLWNTERLFNEILAGMKKCGDAGELPYSVGIDTWAVDYVLLDENDNVIGKTYGYRDSRTEGIPEEVYKIIPEEDLYQRTGIQKQNFNTIFQLYALKLQEPEVLSKAKTFLMLPDYFQFLLTGVKKQEYSNAVSTGLVSALTGDWDKEIMERLGLPVDIFLPISEPGTVVGTLLPEIQEKVGFCAKVVMPATHDTGSAVAAVPSDDSEPLYLSSGTWSLLGMESSSPVLSRKAQAANFSNEGGYDRTIRFQKNIMGLWIIQNLKRELEKYSFDDLCNMAIENKDFPSRVDVDEPRFLAPENMQQAVKDACRDNGLPVPENDGELLAVVYESLSNSYAKSVQELEDITGKTWDTLHIVGGGSADWYLDKITAQKTGKKVLAGPKEATALGNLLAQMISDGTVKDLAEGRKIIKNSFEIKEYTNE